MPVPTDNRLFDAPMQPVQCEKCLAWLQVRKSSWQQTSIQWDAEAMATCTQRQAANGHPARSGFETCPALRDSISRAAIEGALPVPEDGY